DEQRPMGSFGLLQTDLKAEMMAYQNQGHLPLRREDRHAVVNQLISQHPDLEQTLVNLPEVKAMVMGMVPHAPFQQRLQSDSKFYTEVARNVLMGKDPITLAKEQRKA